MTDKKISRFRWAVSFADSSEYAKKYDSVIKMFTDELRGKGYVPVLDLGIHVTVDYDGKVFKYVLTQHGIYVGRKRAWQIDGLAGGKLIPRTTTNKSKASLKK